MPEVTTIGAGSINEFPARSPHRSETCCQTHTGVAATNLSGEKPADLQGRADAMHLVFAVTLAEEETSIFKVGDHTVGDLCIALHLLPLDLEPEATEPSHPICHTPIIAYVTHHQKTCPGQPVRPAWAITRIGR